MTDSARPILFSGEMVRAILGGRKTQTRRVIKPQPDNGCDEFERGMVNEAWQAGEIPIKCPYGRSGDRLWVRETWQDNDPPSGYIYRADWTQYEDDPASGWRPSIFMPRKASRISLEIMNIRVERVQEISEADADAEGVEHQLLTKEERHIHNVIDPSSRWPSRFVYRWLWDKINAKRGFGWDINPWVWVIEFKNSEAKCQTK